MRADRIDAFSFGNRSNIWTNDLPESINALTGNPLTLQLIYNITTVPKVSGLYSIAASIFASIFFCLISSAISRCASVSKGSAFIILSRCACRSSRAAICSLSTVENLSNNAWIFRPKMQNAMSRLLLSGAATHQDFPTAARRLIWDCSASAVPADPD